MLNKCVNKYVKRYLKSAAFCSLSRPPSGNKAEARVQSLHSEGDVLYSVVTFLLWKRISDSYILDDSVTEISEFNFMNLEQGQNAGWKHPLLSYSLLQNHCSWISWEYLMSASNVVDLCVYFSIQFITVLFTMKLGERFYPSVFLNISSSSLFLFHFNFSPSPSSTCLSSSSSHLPFSQSISLLPPSPSFSPLLFSPF